MTSPITIQLVPPDTPPDKKYLLARISFNPNMSADTSPWLIHSGLQQLTTPPVCEDWISASPVHRRQYGNIHCTYNDKILFGRVDLDQGLPLDQIIQNAYNEVLLVLIQKNYPYLLRVWHYLPNINTTENNTTRYHLLCRGRNKAFGTNTMIQRCAATVIGTMSATPSMFFIASRYTGEVIDNPEQTQPWKYPKFAATDKPAFARAVKSSSAAMILISGTASIINSQSIHIGDIAGQTKQIFAHFKNLLQFRPANSKRLAYLKVYLKSATDKDLAEIAICQELSAMNVHPEQILIFTGEVCRPELALEIETLAHL